MYIVSPLHPQIPNCGLKILLLIHKGWNLWMQNPRMQRANCDLLKKKSTNKWTELKAKLLKDRPCMYVCVCV